MDCFEAGGFGVLYVGEVGAGEEGVAGVADVGFAGKIIISVGIADALGGIQSNVTARVPFLEDEIQGYIVAGVFPCGGFHILNLKHINGTQLTNFPHICRHAVDEKRHLSPKGVDLPFVKIYRDSGNHKIAHKIITGKGMLELLFVGYNLHSVGGASELLCLDHEIG